MNVGIVSKWFNRGQPVVGRYIRSAVDELGHRSFVLAKPRREKGPMAGALERTGVWDQPDVTAASSFETPLAEYEAWVEANSLDVILCDQNYQFEQLARLRARGVRIVGRFVWEHFTREHVEPALAAYDVVYSVTRCEQGDAFGLQALLYGDNANGALVIQAPNGLLEVVKADPRQFVAILDVHGTIPAQRCAQFSVLSRKHEGLRLL